VQTAVVKSTLVSFSQFSEGIFFAVIDILKTLSYLKGVIAFV
jgi:hypothetical protein